MRCPEGSEIGTLAQVHGVARPIRIAVGFATAGRAELLVKTLQLLAFQSQAPDAVFISAPRASDVAGVADRFPACQIILGSRGLTRQRNRILDAAAPVADVIVFFDDDFLPCRNYLGKTAVAFASNADVVMTTGQVVKDGIRGPGLGFDEAAETLAKCEDEPSHADEISETGSGYGCNMAVRLGTTAKNRIRFDEDLPLYGWLEDVDFSRRLSRHGRILLLHGAKGIHLGIKSGRESGIKLGYSQIANPIYLARRGSCPWRRALYLISRNVAANLRGLIRPEPYLDRAGRANGNFKGLADLVMGRLSPSRIVGL